MTLPEREELEQALRELRGVEAARVCLDEDEISEIHVAAVPGSRAKNVARDVRSYLLAVLGVDVHHRKISVAVRDAPPPPEPCERVAGAVVDPLAAEDRICNPRVHFRSVNLLVEGLRSEAQVELTAGGRRLVGTVSGVPTALGSERLVAAATLDALAQLTREDLRLVPGDLAFVRLGSGEAVVAEVVLIRPRWEQRLVGACHVGQDRYRSVVFAVLDAMNRILGRLVATDWVEFLVEPHSGAGGRRGTEHD